VQGTRDLSGPSGLTTPQFVKAVRDRLDKALQGSAAQPTAPVKVADAYAVDDALMRELFDSLDADKNGTIDFNEYGRPWLGTAECALSNGRHSLGLNVRNSAIIYRIIGSRWA
jgi:hypothetical protein